MLIEFKVGNFRSFKEIVTLSMVASADKERLETNTFPVDKKLRLIKSAAIYGANASGKSNLFKAMKFMRDWVLKSSAKSSTEEIPVEQFRLSTETENQPSTFEVVFLIDNIRYRYGFQVDRERVHNEWLYFVPSSREATLFTREGDNIHIGSRFKEGRGLDGKTRPNALFLSVVDQFNGEVSRKILKWFQGLKVISGTSEKTYRFFSVEKLDDEEYKQFITDFLKVADLGIEELVKEPRAVEDDEFHATLAKKLFKRSSAPNVSDKGAGDIEIKNINKIEISTVHKKFDENNMPVAEEKFQLQNESAGTQALFAFAAPIYQTLKEGHILVIDELTSKLHPLLTRALIEFFHQYKCKNGDNEAVQGQLIFAGHDTNVLTNLFFRRDQIWFTQKDEYGSTDLYSLEEYQVRKDASYNKDYIMGKYGGIPFIGNIDSLFK
ncbi:MAG: ATP-binding protein [bacterium]|nr:ATP-binding protein [bacterium]